MPDPGAESVLVGLAATDAVGATEVVPAGVGVAPPGSDAETEGVGAPLLMPLPLAVAVTEEEVEATAEALVAGEVVGEAEPVASRGDELALALAA